MKSPCEQCPWRRDNLGQRHFGGFYTRRNLQRLWNQIRRGGRMQSCHITDASHPDHVKAGAKEGRPKPAEECYGSLVLVQRELRTIAEGKTMETIKGEQIERYLKTKKKEVDAQWTHVLPDFAPDRTTDRGWFDEEGKNKRSQ